MAIKAKLFCIIVHCIEGIAIFLVLITLLAGEIKIYFSFMKRGVRDRT